MNERVQTKAKKLIMDVQVVVVAVVIVVGVVGAVVGVVVVDNVASHSAT